MTRQITLWIVAGIGCLLLAVPPVRAQGDRPGGDDRPMARPGEEGRRGRDGDGPRFMERREQRDRGAPEAGDRERPKDGMRMEGQPRREQPAPGPRGPESNMTIIRLQHISAEAYMQAFKQLCHNPAVGEALGKVPVAMCEQANAIVVLGPPEAKAFFHELAVGLDQPSEFHERMHARKMEFQRQEAELGRRMGAPDGAMRGGTWNVAVPGPQQGGPGGGMMGFGRMLMGRMGMGMGPMGKGPMGACPKCQGPMGPCPKCQAPMGICPKCTGGPGACPKCQGAMGGGKGGQPMQHPKPGMPIGPGGQPPMPGAPMPGGPMQGGGMRMPGGPQMPPGAGPMMQRPRMSGDDALVEKLRQRRQAEMKPAMPGSPSAGPKEGKPGEDRIPDEALADPGMPVVKRLLSSPLADRLRLERQQIEKIEQAAAAHRQSIDALRQRIAHAMKDADPKDRQGAAQKMVQSARARIEQLTGELRQRIGEILTADQREALERALRGGEGQDGQKQRGEPRREGPARGEPGQTGPVEAPQAAPGGCGGGGCGGCPMMGEDPQ